MAGALWSTGHKYTLWLDSIAEVDQLLDTLESQWSGPPVDHLCTVWVAAERPGYSTFSSDPYIAAGMGRGLMARWDWPAHFDTQVALTPDGCPSGWTQAVSFIDAEGQPSIQRVSSEVTP